MHRKAFTLIELLVVVLIIGILSAIALPQYTKAVEKSRAAEAMQILKSLRDAQALCILEHGQDSDTCSWGNGGTREIGELFDNISIDIPGEIVGTLSLNGQGIETKHFIYGIIEGPGTSLCAERVDSSSDTDYKYLICTSADPASQYLKRYNQFVCYKENSTICSALGFKKSGNYWIM